MTSPPHHKVSTELTIDAENLSIFTAPKDYGGHTNNYRINTFIILLKT